MKRIVPVLGTVRDPDTGARGPGVTARNPQTGQRLPAEGIVVDRVDAYWRRRAAEGGVRIEDEPEPVAALDVVAPESNPTNVPPAMADSVTPSQPATAKE